MGKSLPVEEYLTELYKQTNNGKEKANYVAVGKALGFDESLSLVIACKLKELNLAMLFLGGEMRMTDKGIVQARGYDVTPKDQMHITIPVNYGQIVHGDINNSQVQINSPGATQAQMFEQMDNEQLIDLLQKIQNAIPDMNLNRNDSRVLKEEIISSKSELSRYSEKSLIVPKLKTILKILSTSSEFATVGGFVMQLVRLVDL
jgi:hypothetical protein